MFVGLKSSNEGVYSLQANVIKFDSYLFGWFYILKWELYLKLTFHLKISHIQCKFQENRKYMVFGKVKLQTKWPDRIKTQI